MLCVPVAHREGETSYLLGECSVCVGVCMGAQEMRQTSSQSCKKPALGFPVDTRQRSSCMSAQTCWGYRSNTVFGLITGMTGDTENKQSHLSAVETPAVVSRV